MPFAVGIVQNAYDEICTLEAAPGGELLALDAKLLREAKQKIPRLKCNSVDVLIIDRIGKEISGFGADPNVTGPHKRDPGGFCRRSGYTEDLYCRSD